MRLFLAIATLLVPLALFAGEQTVTLKVAGNCGACKKKIVKAAEKVDGVADATWDKDTKVFTAKFDDEKSDVKKITAAILSAGYDVEEEKGDDKAYSKLPNCCKYRDGDHED